MTRTIATSPSVVRRSFLVAPLLLGLAGCGEPEDDPHGTAIGALVPFTGVSAASGSNHERAMLLAIEHLNAQSERSGRRFRLVARDSHSERDRTLAGLGQLLDENVIALLGPDDVELVQAVRERLADRALSHLLPSSVTLKDFSNERPGLLIRPAPAAEYVGCALANRIYGDLNQRLVVVHDQDPYRRAFAAATIEAFESYRFAAQAGQAHGLALPDDTDAHFELVSAAAEFAPDTLVVAADAPVAASFVRAWYTLRPGPIRWFFEPALRSDEFLRNVVASSVEGASGISLALPDAAEDFEAAYAARWEGEAPRVESHVYFDAVIAVGLASLIAERELGREPTAAEVAPHVLPVVRGPGSSVSWRELGRAIELIGQARPIHYSGAAGRWSVDANGASDGTAAIFGFWRVREGRIAPERFGACPAGTVSTP